ncbi:hypothetical protein JL720_4761 [Aureococcus anophagefferens]|nr:hypothetical protein JL720_4761 [Aureococcus anophagefferens]
MRITKKFAGATLGKSIFYRTGHLDEPELWRLRRLESLFVRAEETTSAEAIFFAMRGAAQRSGEVVDHPGAPARAARPRRARGAARPRRRQRQRRPRRGARSRAAALNPPPATGPGHHALEARRAAGRPPDDPSAGTVAQSASTPRTRRPRRAASAPARGPGPSSSWAARVAEGAALVTAARRDAELRAARANYSADLRTLVGHSARRGATRTEALRSVSAASAGQSGAVLAAARSAAAVKPATELYSELYGWVPRTSASASPAVRAALGHRGPAQGARRALAEPPPFDAATQRGLHGHERGPGGHEYQPKPRGGPRPYVGAWSDVDRCGDTCPGGDEPRVSYEIRLERAAEYIERSFVLVGWAFNIIAFGAFWMDDVKSHGMDRGGLSLAGIVASSFMLYEAKETEEYTWLDSYFSVMLTFQFLSFVLVVVSSRWERCDEDGGALKLQTLRRTRTTRSLELSPAYRRVFWLHRHFFGGACPVDLAAAASS